MNLEAPLANFGLSEANTDIGETAPYADATAQLIGGSCLRTETGVSASSDGTHGKMLVELVFTCDDASKVTGLQTGLFAAYSGFEHIDAVALSDAGQNAVELTRSATLLTLP